MKHRFWDIYICIVDTSQNIRLLNARYDCLLPEAPSRALWLHKIGELESPWRTLQRFNTLAAWCFAVFLWGYTWLISGINECIYIYTLYYCYWWGYSCDMILLLIVMMIITIGIVIVIIIVLLFCSFMTVAVVTIVVYCHYEYY